MKATNLKNGKRVAVSHGELCFIPVQSAPRGDRSAHKEQIIGHSETGHHHMLTSDKEFEIVEKDGERYAIINELTKLWHNKTFDKHEDVVLAPGKYKITHKTEYDPFQKLVRRVFD